MLTTSGQRLELLDLVPLAVLVRVDGSIESAAGSAVGRDVEMPEGDQHALSATDGQVEFFDSSRFAAADLRGRDPVDALAALVAGQQPALAVADQADPRALGGLGDGVEAFDLEPGLDLEQASFGLGPAAAGGEDVAPGADAHRAQDDRRGGGLGASRLGHLPVLVADDRGNLARGIPVDQFHGQSRRTAGVTTLDLDQVLARQQVLLDVGGHRSVPIVG